MDTPAPDPLHAATLTVRLIKSFEHKNFRNVVLHGVDLTVTNLTHVAEMVGARVADNAVLARLFPPGLLDTFKLYYHPHSAKTNNPIINVGGDERLVLLDWVRPLAELGLVHECEVSFFNWAAYEAYVQDPRALW